jgi:hypothetical protein
MIEPLPSPRPSARCKDRKGDLGLSSLRRTAMRRLHLNSSFSLLSLLGNVGSAVRRKLFGRIRPCRLLATRISCLLCRVGVRRSAASDRIAVAGALG